MKINTNIKLLMMIICMYSKFNKPIHFTSLLRILFYSHYTLKIKQIKQHF